VPLQRRNDGVRIRGAALIAALRQAGCAVTTLTFGAGASDPGDVALPPQPGPWERLLSPTPSLFRCFASNRYKARVAELAPQHDVCVCLGLQMTQFRDVLPTGMPLILDNFNVESDILQGLARRRRGLKRFYWLLQALKLRVYERRALRNAAVALAISESDRNRFEELAPGASIFKMPPGLDLSEYLAARPRPERGRLVFVGALDWHVNIDAACWLARQVFPKVRDRIPHASLSVIGRRPAPEVQQLHGLPGVTLHADVPEVIPHLCAASVVAVPLRFGSGVQTKVIEALAMGRPVVTTSVGRDGLDVRDGREVLVADQADSFAAACVALMQDPARAEAIGESGRGAVRERYSAQRLHLDMLRLLELVRTPR
jgi:polysaccharide biosynthesis protein PslH